MPKKNKKPAEYLSFREHLIEFRRRLFYCVIFIVLGMGSGWVYHAQLTRILARPLGQSLYFTDPTGGLGFVLQISLFAGILLATPVIIYQLLQFVRPISQKISTWLVLRFVFTSFLLAAIGVGFAYFLSLPAALKFLLEISPENITALISADKYLAFVMTYLASFALIFQLPLIMLFINRVTPMSGGKLMRLERPVILVSFIAAAILTPTPDPINQLIMALPMIILYQLAVVCVVIDNKARKVKFKSIPKPAIQEPLATAPIVSQPIMSPISRPKAHMPEVLDLASLNQGIERKQPSSDIFHNANLPIRSMDVRRLKFSD